MIKSLDLSNFKSVSTSLPLDFENFSIICGSNSSGKSSIIQALLMLSQTFSSRYLKSSIALNGPLVRLGSFSDILDYNSKAKSISIKINMKFTQEQLWISSIREVSLDYTFGGRGDNGKNYDSEFHPEIIRGVVKVKNSEGETETISFGEPDSSKSSPEHLFTVKELDSKSKDVLSKEYPYYKIEGCSKLDIVPSVVVVNYDHTKKLSMALVPYLIGSTAYLKSMTHEESEELRKINIPGAFFDKLRSLIDSEYEDRVKSFEIPDEILTMMEGENSRHINIHRVRSLLAQQAMVLTSDILPESSKLNGISVDITAWRAIVESLDEKVKKSFFDFLIRNRETIQGVWYSNNKKIRKKANFSLPAFQELEHYLSFVFERSLKYLGPLRNEPQAMYQAFDLSEPTRVGLKGEYTAAVLHINSNTRIRYPRVREQPEGKIAIDFRYDTLAVACTEWLTYLGVVTSVRTTDRGKLGYEVLVRTTTEDKWQDLTHVGVGVSQVLPIVVMALLSSDDDILIFEQPELHLHPKVQSRLADFFIAISSGTKQCIIETHSEYVINRLRLRIAQSRDDVIRSRSSILFVEKNKGQGSFQSINITPYGAIPVWPADFFDQTDNEVESILIEASNKKRENLLRNTASPRHGETK
ncbi:DUF3696 domain-containing protein [Pseudomonas sp. MLB6B]